MAFTRLKDDPYKIKKDIQQSIDQGLYYLNTPGTNIAYIADPQIRLQQWGANIRTNAIEIENSLRGLNMPLHKDCYESEIPKSKLNKYETHYDEITHQPRLSNPAWNLRCQEKNRWDFPLNKPPMFIPFQEHTRILEKDKFK